MSAELERLRAEIAAQRQAEMDLRRHLGTVAAQLQSASSQILAKCARELNDDLDWYHTQAEPAEPFALAPWRNSAWSAFLKSPTSAIPRRLRVGFTQGDTLAGETPAEYPEQFPVLEAKGALIFDCATQTCRVARELMVNLIVRAALASPSQVKFSLIDPLGLGAAFPMRALLPHVRPAGRAPSDEFSEIIQDIRHINQNVVQQAARLLDVPPEKRAADPFEIVAVVDFPEAYRHDPRAIEYIVRIANSGPRAGRHLLLEWRRDQELPRDFAMTQFSEARIFDCGSRPFQIDPPPAPGTIELLLNAVRDKKSDSQAADWDSVVKPAKFFAETSHDRISTPIGHRLQFWLGEPVGDRPSVHALIAGQPGFGKSSLLHIMITGLAARYSPSELKFVLVDGKQGVEFQAYTHLPHADVVCLRTSPAVALSVLKEFYAEMLSRYALFGEANVFDLPGYRNKTQKRLARKVMVVDEYGVLLEADPLMAGHHLVELAKRGRAAGMHLLLCSHEFEARLMPTDFNRNVQFLASLFLSPQEVQATLFESEGKRMIRELTGAGQVVINDRSGADGANTRGAVARLEPANNRREAVAKIVDQIRRAYGEDGSPVVLTGDAFVTLSENPFVTRWRTTAPSSSELEETARRSLLQGGFGIESWSSADMPIPLWLGRKFDVRGHALAALRRIPDHNLLSIGSETVFRLCMLANAVAGLRSMLDCRNLQILLLDGLRGGRPGSGLLRAAIELLQSENANARVVGSETAIGPALEAFARAHAADSHGDRSRLLIISEPEYFSELYTGSSFGGAPSGPPRILRDLLKTGPQSGLHVMMTASSLGALSSVLSLSREKSFFTHRVVQQMTAEDSSQLFETTAATQIQPRANHPTAVLYVDAVQGVKEGQLFKSYWWSNSRDSREPASGLREALGTLYAKSSKAF